MLMYSKLAFGSVAASQVVGWGEACCCLVRGTHFHPAVWNSGLSELI